MHCFKEGGNYGFISEKLQHQDISAYSDGFSYYIYAFGLAAVYHADYVVLLHGIVSLFGRLWLLAQGVYDGCLRISV